MKARIKIVESKPRCGLDTTSWEQRLGLLDPKTGVRGLPMTAAELIELMGPLWINHPDYKPRARSLLPLPNLVNRVEVQEEEYHVTLWALIVRVMRWVLR